MVVTGFYEESCGEEFKRLHLPAFALFRQSQHEPTPFIICGRMFTILLESCTLDSRETKRMCGLDTSRFVLFYGVSRAT